MTLASRAVALAVFAAVLITAGVLYAVWSSGRIDDDVEARADVIGAEVEAFESQVPAEPTPEAAAFVDESRGEADSIAEPPPTPVVDPRATRAPTAPPPEPTPTPQEPDAPTGFDLGEGDIVVVNRVPGDDYGKLAVRHIDGSRTIVDRTCERVHVATTIGICARRQDTVIPAYEAELFDVADSAWPIITTEDMTRPSRARVAPSGSYAATTGFLSGSSYDDVGSGAATVVNLHPGDGSATLALEDFAIVTEEPRDAGWQFWGITWQDDDAFYVTGSVDDTVEILYGTVSEQVLRPTGLNGSCPSLSPDGRYLVVKELDEDDEIVLVVHDLVEGTDWRLDEAGTVDDQVEWLDDDTILYALHAEDGALLQPRFDIWSLDVTPGATPELFLPAADSPAVPRD